MGQRATKSKARPVGSGDTWREPGDSRPVNHQLPGRSSLGEGGSTINHRAWLLAALLGLVTVVLYLPALHHDFVNYDDTVYVTSNVHVQAGLTLDGVKWAFFKPEMVFGYWHPLTLLSHMLDCQLYGLKPWGHHLTSVLLHALNTMLVFLLFARMTGAWWRSATLAAFFGWHPLHVESVAWIAERKDVLSAFFGLLALLCYARYVDELKIKNDKFKIYYGLALVFFALGLMSKPMLVTLPFVMLLLDWWPLRRGERGEVRGEKAEATQLSPLPTPLSPLWRLVVEKIPFFVLAVAAGGATFVISKKGGDLSPGWNLSLGARTGNALIWDCRYLGELFWPTKLAVFHPYSGPWPVAEVLMAGGLLVVITWLFFAVRRQHRFLLMGWLWFGGTLVPVIGFIPVGDFAMADRFSYLPSIGALVVMVWGAYELTRARRWQARVLSAAGGAAIVLCLGATRKQLGYWQNSETLFRRALAVTKDNYLAHKALGDALDDKGQTDEAIRQFQTALHLKPGFADAHFDLGVALGREGRTDEAIEQYREGLLVKPDYADSHSYLGDALYKQGRIDEAIAEYQEALRLNPNYAEAHNNLGVALAGKGRIDEAISQFREAIRLNPNYAEARNNLGHAFSRQGQVDEAISQYEEAVRMKPDYAEARNNLGFELARKGRMREAINQFQAALLLKPGYVEARDNLGMMLAMEGRMDEAISQFQTALHYKPDDTEARDGLARALGSKNAGVKPLNR